MRFPKRRLANQVMEATSGTKNDQKTKSETKTKKKIEKGTKNDIKDKKDSGFDFQIRWIKP